MTYRQHMPEYVRILQEYGAYGAGGDQVWFVYEHGAELQALREAYRLDAVAGDGDEFDRLSNVASWVSATVPYDGNSVPPPRKEAASILHAALANGTGANCWMQALTACELYLALGYPARYVRCLPYDYRDPDCHVVSLVYAAPLGKWIMLDPSFNAWVHAGDGGIVSLEEMRSRLVMGEPLAVSEGLRGIDPEEYLAYMAKNLVHFESLVVNGVGGDDRPGARYVHLAPGGLDARAWALQALELREAWLRRMREQHPENAAQYDAIASHVAAGRNTVLHYTTYTHDARAFWGAPNNGLNAV